MQYLPQRPDFKSPVSTYMTYVKWQNLQQHLSHWIVKIKGDDPGKGLSTVSTSTFHSQGVKQEGIFLYVD